MEECGFAGILEGCCRQVNGAEWAENLADRACIPFGRSSEMGRPLVIRFFVSCLLLVSLSRADCAHDFRSDKKGGIKVTDFKILGTQTLSSTDLNRFTGQFADSCFNDDSEELQERVRALFQGEGYFKAELKSLTLKPVDPLGDPKLVTVEAELDEGPRFKLGEIQFLKNHAFSSEKLREEFPLKRGDVFGRGAVVTGIQGLHKLYGTHGYLDISFIPETHFDSNATVNLVLTFEEGPQYRLNKVEIVGKKELAEKLYGQWKLRKVRFTTPITWTSLLQAIAVCCRRVSVVKAHRWSKTARTLWWM
jgi:hypothetical protein